jgi:hypothetical protein
MKIYIEISNNGFVEKVHYLPFDEEHGLGRTEEELLTTGHLVDVIPEQPLEQLPVGKKYDLFYNKETHDFSYLIAERELTFAEKLDLANQVNEELILENQELKEKQLLMQQALDELIFGGAL